MYDKLKMQESKNHVPKHYAKAIQPVDYIIANGLDFCEGNIVKYISRYKEKAGVADLKKARHYIDILINQHSKG